jgi:hypothetical protein
MSKTSDINTLYIQENAPLPPAFFIESDSFLPGWRVIKNIDRQVLTQQIEKANWNFFYMAGEIRVRTFGRAGHATLLRLVKRVLAQKDKVQFKFNCLQLTNVTSKTFLGIPYTIVTAHFRHIQPDIKLLLPAEDFVSLIPAPCQEIGASIHLANPIAKRDTVPVSG